MSPLIKSKSTAIILDVRTDNEVAQGFIKNAQQIDFYDENVTIMMDTNSGNVFLTDSEYQVARMNGDRLESFYSCPYCGHKGFIEDMEHEPEDEKCTRYLEEIKVPLYLDWGA